MISQFEILVKKSLPKLDKKTVNSSFFAGGEFL